jgi:hypothetical protein
MKRALTFKTVAKGAGTVVLCLIALDLIATAATLALGVNFANRLHDVKAFARLRS